MADGEDQTVIDAIRSWRTTGERLWWTLAEYLRMLAGLYLAFLGYVLAIVSTRDPELVSGQHGVYQFGGAALVICGLAAVSNVRLELAIALLSAITAASFALGLALISIAGADIDRAPLSQLEPSMFFGVGLFALLLCRRDPSEASASPEEAGTGGAP
jgi:hypothetical protein